MIHVNIEHHQTDNILSVTALRHLYHFIRFSNVINRQVVLQ
jgi:hypothetical protein